MAQAPPDLIQKLFVAPVTKVVRRCDIYEQDGTTPFLLDAPLLSGSVSVDSSRDERRTIDAVLDNSDGKLKHYPRGGFWYDKVIKLFRGIAFDSGVWTVQVGEFMPDAIEEDNFPRQVHVTGRDYTKKLLLSKFWQSTAFLTGDDLESVIRAIAVAGGISAAKIILPNEGKSLGTDFYFEPGYVRWQALKDLCSAYNYEIFFDNQGYLVIREYMDPLLSPTVYTFKTGGDDGNLNKYHKRAADDQIYNIVLVTGSASDSVPVYGVAINTEPSSPTNVDELGERIYQYDSTFISTTDQAQAVADSFLKVHALEQFELTTDSVVIPWLEGGDIVEFEDPDPSPGDPSRFLLSSFTIPMDLSTMESLGRRLTVVG